MCQPIAKITTSGQMFAKSAKKASSESTISAYSETATCTTISSFAKDVWTVST